MFISLVVVPEGSALLIAKLAIGYDPETVSSISIQE
jgi:hypothetical protein